MQKECANSTIGSQTKFAEEELCRRTCHRGARQSKSCSARIGGRRQIVHVAERAREMQHDLPWLSGRLRSLLLSILLRHGLRRQLQLLHGRWLLDVELWKQRLELGHVILVRRCLLLDARTKRGRMRERRYALNQPVDLGKRRVLLLHGRHARGACRPIHSLEIARSGCGRC